MFIADLETPAVLIDLDKAIGNLERAQSAANAAGVRLRPHIKTHKLPYFAHAQIKLGAAGITCQKLGEAEVMADAGIDDIFLPYNILGAAKLSRLKAFSERVRLSVTADNGVVISGYAEMFGAESPLTVLVECDTGMGRCGVQTPAEAVGLAARISEAPGLVFGGLMTYPPAGAIAKAEQVLSSMAKACEAAGLPVAVISSGGSPDFYTSIGSTIATEYRPGTYIYGDRQQVHAGSCTLDNCALSVLATIVSCPTPDRAIIDAGSKSLGTDPCPTGGFGHVIEFPDAIVRALNEEHGILDVSNCSEKPAIGQAVRVIPNHVCIVSNLFDQVHLIRGDQVEEALPVAARGLVR